MGSLWAAGLLLRRLRTEMGALLLLFVVIAATSFLFAAAPRLFDRASDDGLRFAALAASPIQRDLVLAEVDSLSPGVDGGVATVRAQGDDLAKRFPASLAALISDRSLRVTTARFSVTDPPSYETYVSLRYQDGLTDATRLVSGRWPVDRGVVLPPATSVIGSGTPGGGNPAEPVILEAAMGAAVAAEIGVHVGDRLAVTLDGRDPLIEGARQVVPTRIQVVGLFEPIDPNAPYWSGDPSLRVSPAGTEDTPVARVTADIAAETYRAVWSSGLPFRYEWRYQIDPQRLVAGQVAQWQEDLRHLDFVTGFSETRVARHRRHAQRPAPDPRYLCHTARMGGVDPVRLPRSAPSSWPAASWACSPSCSARAGAPPWRSPAVAERPARWCWARSCGRPSSSPAAPPWWACLPRRASSPRQPASSPRLWRSRSGGQPSSC